MPIEIKELHIKAIVASASKENKTKQADIDMVKLKKDLVNNVLRK
jgi:hypothetical protein